MMSSNNLVEINAENICKVFRIDFEDSEFSIKNIANKEFLKKLLLKQAILYYYDSVVSDYIDNIDIDLDNMIEGRFFNEDTEIRIFNDDDGLKGSIFSEKLLNADGENEYFDERYILYNRNRLKNYATHLKVRKYISYDEDKQAYIYYTKPCKLEFGGEER